MNCSSERSFTASSDAYVTLSSYKNEASLRVSDSHSSETVSIKGFSTIQLRSALNGYVSGLRYHDTEAKQAIEFCQELQIVCRDVIERLTPEQSETTAS